MESTATVAPPYIAGPLRLLPFRALMLAPRRIGDAGLGRTFARPYRDVAARLTAWRQTGQITQSERPALYLHEYTAAGITIRGLVGVLDVSRRATGPQDRAVFPHEGIHPAQADELADRMGEMRLNPAPILLVHRSSDELKALLADVTRCEPAHVYTDRNEQHHRIWELTDPALLDDIARGIAPAQALIADGHHRYAAYLRMQQRDPGGPADYGLAMLVDQRDTPLFLGAIHRVLEGSSLQDLCDAVVSMGGRYTPLPEADAVRQLGPDTLVATDSKKWAAVHITVPPGRTAVEILHHDIVPRLTHGPRRINYHHTAHGALDHARPGADIALLLPAAPVDVVLDLVASDRLLPEKATSFQPKPNLGALIRSLDDALDEPR